MSMQLYLARGISAGRIHADQDHAQLRNVELALLEARRERRSAARSTRRR